MHRKSLAPGRIAGTAVLITMLAATYVPVVMIVVYSFNESRQASYWTRFSLQPYAQLFSERAMWAALRTSLFIGATVSTLSLILGTMAALGLHRWTHRPRRVAEGLISLPLVVPDVILGVSLAVFFYAIGTQQGPTTVILAQTAFGLAYAFVVMAAAVNDLDPSIHAAALDCGATRWRAFWLVTVPLLSPSLLVAWMLVFSLSFDDFLITFFTKGVGNDTLPIWIYGQIRFGVQPKTNALFVVLFLATTIVLLTAHRLRRRTSN